MIKGQVVKHAAQAVVMVKVTARADARSGAELGFERRGSGVVIDRAGHVLTTVYLVVDAESIELMSQGGWASMPRAVLHDLLEQISQLTCRL